MSETHRDWLDRCWRNADETTYTVEEAEIGDDEGFEVIVVYLQEWCNKEMSDFGDDKTEEKAFIHWTKGDMLFIITTLELSTRTEKMKI